MCICVSVWAAESRRRERAPQTSAPAGDRAGGSVPHDPHRWDSSPWGFSLKSLHFRHISVVSSLLPLTDYLNNLSPDSKEYEDTQGTIKAWSILCKPPGSSRLCSWYKWRMYLLSGHRRYSQEGQFRFFSLYCWPTRQLLQPCPVWRRWCVIHEEKHLYFWEGSRDLFGLLYQEALNPDMCMCVCLIRQQKNNNQEWFFFFFLFQLRWLQCPI